METVMISLELKGYDPVDIRLPAYVAAHQLISVLRDKFIPALSWKLQGDFILNVYPPGETTPIPIGASQSLAEVGCWSGSRLVLVQNSI